MDEIDRETSDKMMAALDQCNVLIGRVASRWAALEHRFDHMIWKLAEVEPALGACITTQLGGIHSRIKVLVALLGLRNGSEVVIKDINKLSASIHGELEQRNRIVHDVWAVTKALEVTQIRVAIMKNQLALQEVPVSLDELRGTWEAIGRRHASLEPIEQAIDALLEPSPNKWREPLPQIFLGMTALVTPKTET